MLPEVEPPPIHWSGELPSSPKASTSTEYLLEVSPCALLSKLLWSAVSERFTFFVRLRRRG